MVIARSHSHALDLMLAIPAAALGGGLGWAMVALIINASDWDAIPYFISFVVLFSLPVLCVIAIPGYFLLRFLNALQIRWFLLVGGGAGGLLGYLDPKWSPYFLIFGLTGAASGYAVLAWQAKAR